MHFCYKPHANGRWGIYRDLGQALELLATIEDQATAKYLVASLNHAQHLAPNELEAQFAEVGSWQQQVIIPSPELAEAHRVA